MTNEDKIEELIGLYWDLISCDHHKTKDSKFYVSKEYSAYDKSEWVAYHDGYISDFYETADTREEAEQAMIRHLKIIIKDQLETTFKAIASPDEWDIYTVGETRAKEIQEELKKYD